MRFELAVCVLLPTGEQGYVQAISRRNDNTKWGIPGGKLEHGETAAMAAVREIKEECGILLQSNNLVPIYSGPCYGADGRDFWVTTYLNLGPYEGTLKAEEGFELRKFHISDLCKKENSPFDVYNYEVFNSWLRFNCCTTSS